MANGNLIISAILELKEEVEQIALQAESYNPLLVDLYDHLSDLEGLMAENS